jgi:beta-N-acetylhexosaminidase
VTTYARQFINAHEQAGVLTSAKHFPGHGSARGDPHDEIVDIGKTWRPSELQPFRNLIAGGFVDMVMVGHLIHPRFSDDGDVPASLSALAVQKELRGKLGYRGLVITDDLDMGAIRSRYGIEEAAVMAIAAGADLLIIANHKTPDKRIADRIIAAVSKAVTDGRISREQIREAWRMIAKQKHALADKRAFVMD